MKNLLRNNKKAFIITSVFVGLAILAILGTVVYSMIQPNEGQSVIEKREDIQTFDNFNLIEDDMVAEQFDIPEEEAGNTTKNEEADNNNGTTGGNPYYIKVNKALNVVTVFTKDDEGNYTVPVKAMICSTGVFTPSCGKYPKTSYKITGGKRRWAVLQGGVYGQYATQIVGNILFHSVPYVAQDPSALEYWEYDKLGTSASAGCIRLTVADAQWIYNNISGGTIVEFCTDSAPLGKPSAQKISGNEQCRGWDPTDYTDGNPWRNVVQETKNEETPVPTNVPQNNEEKTNTENTAPQIIENEKEKDNNVSNIEDSETNDNQTITNDEKKDSDEEKEEKPVNKEDSKEEKEEKENKSDNKEDSSL